MDLTNQTTTLCSRCLLKNQENHMWFNPLAMLMSWPPKYILHCKVCRFVESTTKLPTTMTFPPITETETTPEVEIQIGDRTYTVDESYEIEFVKRQLEKLNEIQDEIYENLIERLGLSSRETNEVWLYDYIFNNFVLRNKKNENEG
jgi:hypothetical protein